MFSPVSVGRDGLSKDMMNMIVGISYGEGFSRWRGPLVQRPWGRSAPRMLRSNCGEERTGDEARGSRGQRSLGRDSPVRPCRLLQEFQFLNRRFVFLSD